MRRREGDRTVPRHCRVLDASRSEMHGEMQALRRPSVPRGPAARVVTSWAGYGPLAARATVARGAQGVMLSRKPGPDGADCFEVSIVFDEGRTPTPILFAADDTDVVARWRRYAADLGLPLVIQDAEGVQHAPWGQIGRVRLGSVRIRRRSAHLAQRRPRFLTRRRMGLQVLAGA